MPLQTKQCGLLWVLEIPIHSEPRVSHLIEIVLLSRIGLDPFIGKLFRPLNGPLFQLSDVWHVCVTAHAVNRHIQRSANPREVAVFSFVHNSTICRSLEKYQLRLVFFVIRTNYHRFNPLSIQRLETLQCNPILCCATPIRTQCLQLCHLLSDLFGCSHHAQYSMTCATTQEQSEQSAKIFSPRMCRVWQCNYQITHDQCATA